MGVIDIQSQDLNAFSEADLSVLQSLADQVAIAIALAVENVLVAESALAGKVVLALLNGGHGVLVAGEADNRTVVVAVLQHEHGILVAPADDCAPVVVGGIGRCGHRKGGESSENGDKGDTICKELHFPKNLFVGVIR